MNLFWLVCLFSQSAFALDSVMITGSWSPWSTRASPCFQSPTEQNVIVLCGVGMTRRYRSCTNPTPQGGGANCSGLAEQWTPCNTQECQLPDGNYTRKFSVIVFYLLTRVDPHPTVVRKKRNCAMHMCVSQNGMLCHALGGAVTFLSLQHFILPCLNLMLCLSVCLVVFCLLALPT